MDWPALTMVLGEGSCPHRVCLAVVYPPADDARVIVAGRVGLQAAMRGAACSNVWGCRRQCEELLAAMPEGLKAAMPFNHAVRHTAYWQGWGMLPGMSLLAVYLLYETVSVSPLVHHEEDIAYVDTDAACESRVEEYVA